MQSKAEDEGILAYPKGTSFGRMSRTTTQLCAYRGVELVWIFVWFAIVAGNGSTGFTSKMNYYNTEGNFKRHQMVLLDASKIEVDDGITLADKL